MSTKTAKTTITETRKLDQDLLESILCDHYGLDKANTKFGWWTYPETSVDITETRTYDLEPEMAEALIDKARV